MSPHESHYVVTGYLVSSQIDFVYYLQVDYNASPKRYQHAVPSFAIREFVVLLLLLRQQLEQCRLVHLVRGVVHVLLVNGVSVQ